LLGEKRRDEPMFYYVKLDDMIPEDHLLRLIHRYVDFSFIRSKVKHLYSHTGRPSIDPELLLRMLLIGYLYGITSERRLCEQTNWGQPLTFDKLSAILCHDLHHHILID